MPEGTQLLVLDTHAWVWLMEGDVCLDAAVRKAIQAAVPARGLRVCAISVWEVAMLEAKGRLVFDLGCGAWVDRALAAPGVVLAPLTPEIAVASTRLPGDFHGDPADRILAATVRACGGTLVTADRALLAYGKSGHLATLPIRGRRTRA